MQVKLVFLTLIVVQFACASERNVRVAEGDMPPQKLIEQESTAATRALIE